MDDFDAEMNSALYGPAGTGKTTLASTYPGPILFMDFSERGTDSIRDVKNVQVLRVKNFQQARDIYWAARKGKLIHKKTGKPFKTIVWDTVSQAQSIVIRELKEKKGVEVKKGSEANWGTMTKKDWGEVSSTMKEWITNYRDLDGINMVFIAHDRVFNGGDDEDTDDDEAKLTPQVGPALSPSVAATLNAAVNIIGNTFISEKFVKIKLGKGKTKTERKVVYCLRVGPHSRYITKIRKPRSHKVPAVIEDPSYEDLLEYVQGE